ncbi:MAG: hypothetical protein J0I93_04865 [Legionella sp.]|nr:hypothetical protein [Legionella sp.]
MDQPQTLIITEIIDERLIKSWQFILNRPSINQIARFYLMIAYLRGYLLDSIL